MSSWLAPAGPRQCCGASAAPYQSCLRRTSTRSAQALSRSLSRPGTNATGFTQFEYTLSAKWLELLREIAPGLTRAAVVRDAEGSAGIGQWAAIQAAAGPLGVELTPIDPRDIREMQRAVSALAQIAQSARSGAAPARLRSHHRQHIVAGATRHKLPAVYPYRHFVASGGLVSYGVDLTNLYRRAAGYVDRILKGEKPADLPVQNPAKYELVINLKTAKALGLDVPASCSPAPTR